ncbi:MAG: hypothetical protein GF365_03715 [Candidatus Buchananbacteria bacterium]|nr:hypothetical protein [Candidatus Buchananbacteria bacterium]
MIYDHEVDELLLYSSEVEELFFEGDKLKIRFGQHEWFLNLTDFQVVRVKTVHSKGTAARFNSKKHILFFAEEAHQKSCLISWNLPTDILNDYLEEVKSEPILPLAEIIPFPVDLPVKTVTGYQQLPVAGGMKT